MLLVNASSAWSMTFYDSMGACKGNKDREHYTSYSGTGISCYIRAGDQGTHSTCLTSIDGGHSLQECVAGPLDPHNLWFNVGSNTHCRWSISGLNLDPSENEGDERGETGKCYSMTSSIGKVPDEFWFQCGDVDNPYWDD
jgi:hypothetical protein